jgi:hypothetical protein
MEHTRHPDCRTGEIMTDILPIYLVGVAVAAFVHGYATPVASLSRNGLPMLYLSSFLWPLIFISALGNACRMFSVKRIAEDADARP